MPVSRRSFLPFLFAGAAFFGFSSVPASGFGFFAGDGLSGGARWDAAPRLISGDERSLAGGLRFSLQGSSYEAYRDLFTWQSAPPPVADFQAAIEGAFAAWMSIDLETGLGTSLQFVADLTTEVSPLVSNNVRRGAEIDLLGATSASTWTTGNSVTRAEAGLSFVGTGTAGLTLTSGTTGYSGFAISGADITFNSNPQAKWTLPVFRTILTHEIGHTLGLRDVDVDAGPAGQFVDDNYSAADALGTLTNAFAHLINPLNPAASPLAVYAVANGNPGFDTPGVDLLMESAIPSSAFNKTNPLSNDEYAGRQFLYPVPEPGAGLLAVCGALWLFTCLPRRAR